MIPTSIGAVIDDKYEIVGEVGRGGMSIVWLARDVRLEKMWAVKEVKPNVGGEHGRLLRQAIVDEANFMKRLDHPAIPRVVDIIDTGAELYVVMDYVNGRPLSRVLAQRGRPFSQEEVVRWGIQLCDVLEYLHGFTTPEGERHQIVYRDLKPANVMLRDDNQVRLIDFGVSWERTGGANNDGKVVGTPGYAAPEQIPAGSDVTCLPSDVVIDGRTDVYALGATLYSLVSGHVPKVVKGAHGTNAVSFDMRPIRAWDPTLSEGLEHVLEKATRRELTERYQTIAEMRYDLEHYERLTCAYRAAQEAKVAGFRRRLVASLGCVACGVACLGLSALAQMTSYESLMQEASIASVEPADGHSVSMAEQLYARAIEADPSRAESFEALISKVYEQDGVFDEGEEERWNSLFRRYEHFLRPSAGYARLCFDAGVCYLCFYGVVEGGGGGASLGQGALVSAGKARSWFERVEAACNVRSAGEEAVSTPAVSFDKGAQDIDDADVRAAHVYLQIAEFNDLKQRAAREGRAAGEAYRSFWNALRQAVGTSSLYIEGVRLRLYQIAFEALAADDVLDGVYRVALEDGCVDELRGEAQGLLEAIEEFVGSEEMKRFAEAPSNRDVYGPMYRQMADNLDLARKNIARTFENPVARTDKWLT
ncbi:MAG: serine/threonine protein kinase [Atopobiaceae bacterium]|nr:serine/threonine protein kinase [Atopobiaceae bacterium]